VAFRALDGLVGAVEGEGGGGVVEGGAGVAKRGGSHMAANAIGAESAGVDVLVARGAVRRQIQIGARLVALAAFSRDCCVTPVEGKPGFLEMVEVALLYRTDVRFPARVLDVADDAIIAGVAMKAASLVDPLGDRLVAAQALLRGNALPRLVTFFAVPDALELFMGRTQGTGRQELADHLRCGGCGDLQDNQPCQSSNQGARQRLGHSAHP